MELPRLIASFSAATVMDLLISSISMYSSSDGDELWSLVSGKEETLSERSMSSDESISIASLNERDNAALFLPLGESNSSVRLYKKDTVV